jgi:hypothetical protein
MKVVLISCVGKKKDYRCKARDLYDSTWFRLAWRYAKSLNPDEVFILSAKYGLVDQNSVITPYEETLNTKSDREIKTWADRVMKELRKATNVDRDVFIILAGEKYRRHLIRFLPNPKVPMDGLRIGEQQKWLKAHSPK